MARSEDKRLSDDQLTELIALVKDADSVELKLTVPTTDQRSTVAALGIDPLEAQIRQVFFFDTPDLALNEPGVVVRARRVQGKGDDSVVKLRPVVPDELPAELRRIAGLRRRGRRHARRLRLLGVVEGEARHDRRPRGGRAASSRSASCSRRSSARSSPTHAPDGDRARRPLDPRPDLRPQAQVLAAGFDRQMGPRCGSTRTARGSSSSRPSACRPRRSRPPPSRERSWLRRDRSQRRAADEDADGAGGSRGERLSRRSSLLVLVA